jgi:hypothetical protein
MDTVMNLGAGIGLGKTILIASTGQFRFIIFPADSKRRLLLNMKLLRLPR